MPYRTHLPLLRIAVVVAIMGGVAISVPAAATDRVVVVKPGDTLSEIALRYGMTVAQLRELNGIPDPNRIFAGQRLRLTGKPPAVAKAPSADRAGVVHVVASGETLTAIAHRYGSTIAAIATANGIRNPSNLRVGQRLTIPGAGTAPAAPAAKMSTTMSALVAARADIGSIIRAEATAQGVPVAFALAVAWHESGWRPDVVSSAGAVGVMQLTPPTVDWVGTSMLGHQVDPHDARSNVKAGITLLKHYLGRYHGDRSLVLAAYYQGQTAADRYGVYSMTRPYIASILALEAFFAS
jgi:N-acetylmuramoyl-L-alanine amidase